MGLKDEIVDKIRAVDKSRFAVIINARYYTYKRKMVYVRLDTDTNDVNLEFFTNDDAAGTTNAVPDAFHEIRRELMSSVLFGVKVSRPPAVNSYKITVNALLGIIVFESVLYAAARKIAQMECDAGKGLDYSTIALSLAPGKVESAETVQDLVQSFWLESRVRYQELVYAGRNNRFVNRLLKAHKFYTVERAFVPVFIECGLFFNPMRDPMIAKTRMYADAVRKNRLIQVVVGDSEISGYFLTHEEICRAFGMRHFMRFTPNFWYKIFMGLVYPTMGSFFPTKGVKNWFTEDASVSSFGLKPVYSEQEMVSLLRQLDESDEINLNGISAASDEIKEVLKLYELKYSIFTACKEAYYSLVSVGSTALDQSSASTVHNIYAYVTEAQLLL